MTNEELAQGLFKQATSRYKTMGEAFQGEDYPYVVRLAQECVINRLYSRYDAETAKTWAEKVFFICSQFFKAKPK